MAETAEGLFARRISRRAVLGAGIGAGLAAGGLGVMRIPIEVLAAPRAVPAVERGYLSPARMRTLIAAVGRLVPSDTSALGGAVEWGAFNYVQRLLTRGVDALYAGGPVRCAFPAFIAAWPAKAAGWSVQVDAWRQAYADGLDGLDAGARSRYGMAFADLPAAMQTQLLLEQDDADTPFFRALYEHTMEGCYANPVYGGNAGMLGWRAFGYRGDTHGVSGDDPVLDFAPGSGASSQLGLHYSASYGTNPFGLVDTGYSGRVYVPDGWQPYAACGIPTGGYRESVMASPQPALEVPLVDATCARACVPGSAARAAGAPAANGLLPNTGSAPAGLAVAAAAATALSGAAAAGHRRRASRPEAAE
jgi:gluconate 2-dehydrogenase gamma chain